MTVTRFVFVRLREPSDAARAAFNAAAAAAAPGVARFLPLDDAAIRAWDLGLVIRGDAETVAAQAAAVDAFIAARGDVQVVKAWAFGDG